MWRELPPAVRFLRTAGGRRAHAIVHAFHRWLDRRRLTLSELTPDHLRQFFADPRRARVSPKIRARCEHWLRGYLQWLHDRGLIDFAPEPPQLRPPALSSLARAFLASLAPTHRPSTIERYAYSLRKLHDWLDASGLEPQHLTRSELAPWFQWLHAAGLHPGSRRTILVDVRGYLYWLCERRRIRTAPDELIRRSDLPKLPQYLPRPLTAEADRELQRRLDSSHEPAAWALLLMRRTGLRIGELRGLEYHCIRPHERHPLLKVPLGKLNNERLVPIDAALVELIRKLQSTGLHARSWLVPGLGSARMSYGRFRRILNLHSNDLPDPVRITSHRLRHTFATEMLGAGMSLLGVMRLLGHRDYHMTLRYAAITPETVGDEYAKALAQLAMKYQLPARLPTPEVALDPDELLDRLSRWLQKHTSSHQPLRPLLKRIERMRHDLRSLRVAKLKP
jgi:site-specific recombinase XerD